MALIIKLEFQVCTRWREEYSHLLLSNPRFALRGAIQKLRVLRPRRWLLSGKNEGRGLEHERSSEMLRTGRRMEPCSSPVKMTVISHIHTTYRRASNSSEKLSRLGIERNYSRSTGEAVCGWRSPKCKSCCPWLLLLSKSPED